MFHVKIPSFDKKEKEKTTIVPVENMLHDL